MHYIDTFSNRIINRNIYMKIVSTKRYLLYKHLPLLRLFSFVDNYDRLTISPEPDLNEVNKITVKEGDIIGPFNCSADCNPPCAITWKLKTTSGYSDPPQKEGLLLALVVKRDMEFVRCVAQWIYTNKTIHKGILLDVQCKYLFIFIIPFLFI